MFKIHNFEPLTAEARPQDPGHDAEGWEFETLEHGGHEQDQMPQAIRATDPEGRSCVYVPITENGVPVKSLGFIYSLTPGEHVQLKPPPPTTPPEE